MTGDSGADRKGGPIRRFMQRMQQKNPSTSWSLADCKAVLSTHPDDVEALHECGVKLARNGCLPEAVDAFERILTLDDAHKESYKTSRTSRSNEAIWTSRSSSTAPHCQSTPTTASLWRTSRWYTAAGATAKPTSPRCARAREDSAGYTGWFAGSWGRAPRGCAALPQSLRSCRIVPSELCDFVGDYAAQSVALGMRSDRSWMWKDK